MCLETKSLEKISKETVLKLCRSYPCILRADVEDSVQNAFLSALERDGNLDGVNASWLYLTARCRLIDKLRRDKRSIHQLPERLLDDEGQTLIDIALDSKSQEIKTIAQSLAYPDQQA